MSKLLSLRTQLKAAKAEVIIRSRMANTAIRAHERAINRVTQLNERIVREINKAKLAQAKRHTKPVNRRRVITDAY